MKLITSFISCKIFCGSFAKTLDVALSARVFLSCYWIEYWGRYIYLLLLSTLKGIRAFSCILCCYFSSMRLNNSFTKTFYTSYSGLIYTLKVYIRRTSLWYKDQSFIFIFISFTLDIYALLLFQLSNNTEHALSNIDLLHLLQTWLFWKEKKRKIQLTYKY